MNGKPLCLGIHHLPDQERQAAALVLVDGIHGHKRVVEIRQSFGVRLGLGGFLVLQNCQLELAHCRGALRNDRLEQMIAPLHRLPGHCGIGQPAEIVVVELGDQRLKGQPTDWIVAHPDRHLHGVRCQLGSLFEIWCRAHSSPLPVSMRFPSTRNSSPVSAAKGAPFFPAARTASARPVQRSL